MDKIVYIDRATGEHKEELVPGGGFLKFLYGSTVGKLSLNTLVKRKLFSIMGGAYMNSKASAKKIAPFIAKHSMDMSDYIVPEEGFSCFNDFFYRKIDASKRPIGEGVVSPADGKILVFDTIAASKEFFIKGSLFNLTSFLADEKLAKKYEGGAMCIVRLAPVDYHRFHFPAEGKAGKMVRIKGDYYSVSPLALRKSLEIFCQNKREYCIQETKDYGDILICDVGATLTGSIIQTYTEEAHQPKGGDRGFFAFGGSTTVLLFEQGKIKFSKDLITNTQAGLETTIKMGETIAQ
ncbi:MAG: phosphatidylserine decarboxylase [Flavipsychrobacter sp.]